MNEQEGEFIEHGPCDHCGSSDARAFYTDHSFCFACPEKTAWQPIDGETPKPQTKRKRVAGLIPAGEFVALPKRKLTEESCRKWGYSVGVANARIFGADFPNKQVPVQIATYRDPETGAAVAQKVRDKDKNMAMTGEGKKKPPLYGLHLWRDAGRRIVITEGEIDAISVSQLQDHKWPVVSVPTGAKGAKKALQRHIDKLVKFDEVVLLFDNDEEGQAAVAECAPLFPPGKCKVAKLPLKDANEMLKAGRGDEVITAIWEAKAYRPDGIVTIADIREKILTPPQEGLPWCFETLTKLTYGRRFGETYGWGAGTGIGKSDVFAQQIAYDAGLGLASAVFSSEQNPGETGKRVAGKMAGKRFHVPAEVGKWTQKELEQTLDKLEASGKLFFYDSFGAWDWEIIRGTIRLLAHNDGVKVFYIDNLTALVAQEEDELTAFKRIMSEMASLAKELHVIINYVSHLATPTEGPPHEEGGRVMVRHFRGSRVIGYWTNFMFGLERNKSAKKPEDRLKTILRCVKDRNSGDAEGECVYLVYDRATGLLNETGKFEMNSEDYGEDF